MVWHHLWDEGNQGDYSSLVLNGEGNSFKYQEEKREDGAQTLRNDFGCDFMKDFLIENESSLLKYIIWTNGELSKSLHGIFGIVCQRQVAIRYEDNR